MSLAHLGENGLNLDLDQVLRRSRFLQAYARTCLLDLEELSNTNIRPSFRSVQAQWDVQADAASTLVDAAEIASLYDSDLSASLFDQAGRHYIELGHPYGLYLRSIAGRWQEEEYDSLFRVGLRAMERLSSASSDASNDQPLPRAWHSPQQQVYFLLAAAGTESVRREQGGELVRLAIASPHRQGVAPTGAIGTSLFRLWDIATRLLNDDNPDETAAAICEHLAEMSTRYAERIRLAMVNQYLWRHAASPVNLTDIEILGVSVLTAREVSLEIFSAHLERVMWNLPPLARVPAELGIEITVPPPEEPLYA